MSISNEQLKLELPKDELVVRAMPGEMPHELVARLGDLANNSNASQTGEHNGKEVVMEPGYTETQGLSQLTPKS